MADHSMPRKQILVTLDLFCLQCIYPTALLSPCALLFISLYAPLYVEQAAHVVSYYLGLMDSFIRIYIRMSMVYVHTISLPV